MIVSILLAALWAFVAIRIGIRPDRLHAPMSRAILIAGVPLLGLITMQTGPVGGAVSLVIGGCVIGWPLIGRSGSLEGDR
jgi:hypothetical protein